MQKRWITLDQAVKDIEARGAVADGGTELPEHQQVQPHISADHVIFDHHGVRYQKCGGGRRIIRKHRGE